MGVRFDYDFETNDVLVHDAPKDSTVIVDGVKYAPERTCKGCFFDGNQELPDIGCEGCCRYASYPDKYLAKTVEYKVSDVVFKRCMFCKNESAVKLFHHGEYAWSKDFSIDEKNVANVLVCISCGRVTMLDTKVVE